MLDPIDVVRRLCKVGQQLTLLAGVEVGDAIEFLIEESDEELVGGMSIWVIEQSGRLYVAVVQIVAVDLGGNVVDAVALKAVDGALELLIAVLRASAGLMLLAALLAHPI